MWFFFTILTILAWGAGEFFYKAGNDYEDDYSSSRTVVMVGLFFGLYVLIYYVLIQHLAYDWHSFITYLPVSASYIISMWLGYVGLRYLEVSIVGPVSNASGAVTAIFLVLFAGQKITGFAWFAIALVTIGIILISLNEKEEMDELAADATPEEKKRYRIGAIAIIFPILYMIFDSLGTFFDGIVLDAHKFTMFGKTIHWALDEDQAQMSYMLAFFFLGVVVFLWLTLVKKQKFTIRGERYRGIAGILETIGQVFYVFAMSGNAVIAAPLIASYAVFSVILGHIFLKERLRWVQYLAVGLVILGTVIIGYYDF
ncbi:MAG: DMT family transporter [Lactobacillales bacterium]|nr:DMT family transporter [Lactobacillales bacterium]